MKILLIGATGGMGKVLQELISQQNDMDLVAGVCQHPRSYDFPLYESVDEVEEDFDTVIDFSSPEASKSMLGSLLGEEKRIVLATTGLNEEIQDLIDQVGQTNAILQASNTSYGVHVMDQTLQVLSETLKDYEVEIVEIHHNRKVDAPSGTAELFYDAVAKSRPEAYPIYDRAEIHEKRKADEIYMASLRVGNVAGEHMVIFSKGDEIIQMKHSALSKKVFAEGALRIARFLKDQAPGRYRIEDLS